MNGVMRTKAGQAGNNTATQAYISSMNPKLVILALCLIVLTACQGNTSADPASTKPLDSKDLSRLALEHDVACWNETRNSADTFIPPGTPVEITGVCEIPRDIPVFAIDWPDNSTYDLKKSQRSYRAHLEDNAEVAQMKKGQRYLVKGRIGRGSETMCYGAYFIDVDSFNAID